MMITASWMPKYLNFEFHLTVQCFDITIKITVYSKHISFNTPSVDHVVKWLKSKSRFLLIPEIFNRFINHLVLALTLSHTLNQQTNSKTDKICKTLKLGKPNW